MGEYFYVVNLDKKEYVHPHELGEGLKLGEGIGLPHGTSAALSILVSAGGADYGTKWISPVWGRWAGDRIARVGDYGGTKFLIDGKETSAADIYQMCDKEFKNITAEVATAIETFTGGKFSGDGWRTFTEKSR